MARMASPSPSIETAWPPRKIRVRSVRAGAATCRSGRRVVAEGVLGEPVRGACGTVLVGLGCLVRRGDGGDLPGQFAAVYGPPAGRDVEHVDRPDPASGGRVGHAPGIAALLAGPGEVRPPPPKPHGPILVRSWSLVNAPGQHRKPALASRRRLYLRLEQAERGALDGERDEA